MLKVNWCPLYCNLGRKILFILKVTIRHEIVLRNFDITLKLAAKHLVVFDVRYMRDSNVQP